MPNQIAFYPQSSGGGAGSMQLIAEQTPSSAQQVTFLSIPQTFKHLKVFVYGWTFSGTAQTAFMWFNNDTSASYFNSSIVLSSSTVVGTSPGAASTSMPIGSSGWGTGSTLFTSGLEINIPGYTNTSLPKVMTSVTTGNTGIAMFGGQYGSGASGVAAISRIDLFASNNWFTGATFSLYGIQ